MFGIFKSSTEKRNKEAHELALKLALAEKMAKYDPDLSIPDDRYDYTQITINGKNLRVKKEQITIFNIAENASILEH